MAHFASSRTARFIASLTLTLLMLGSMLGTAFAQDEELGSYSDTQGPAVPGGTVRFLLYEDPNTLNPIGGATSIAFQVINSIIEGLAENAPDGSFVPVLAAEIPTLDNGGISADLTTVTWKLKEGLLWSDGTPVTSEDVKFTWEAAKDPINSSAVASDYALITDIQTPDPLTVVISYDSFNAGYADQFPWILPKHASGEVTDMANWPTNRAPIGTGPFKLDEWSSGEFIQLSRNENYREEGKPYLENLTFLVVPDEAVRAAMMQEEGSEIMLWAGNEAEEQIEASGVATGRTAPGIWVLEMRFNLSMPFDGDPGLTPAHPMLGDVNVRKAITMAVDRNRINHELLSNSTVYDLDSPLDVGWMGCQVDPFAFDREGAMALLEAAGWKDEDGDGIREAHGVAGVEDGTKFTVTMNGYTGFSTLDLVELAVQEDLKAVGIDAKIENQEFAVIFGTWEDNSPRKTGDFDILIYDAGLFAEPGSDIYNRYAPDQVPSAEATGGENFYRWVREDVGEWIATANSSPDPEVRRENFCNVATAIREDIITFPILQFAEGSVYSNKMHGYTVSTWEWATWDSENWWIEQ